MFLRDWEKGESLDMLQVFRLRSSIGHLYLPSNCPLHKKWNPRRDRWMDGLRVFEILPSWAFCLLAPGNSKQSLSCGPLWFPRWGLFVPRYNAVPRATGTFSAQRLGAPLVPTRPAPETAGDKLSRQLCLVRIVHPATRLPKQCMGYSKVVPFLLL